MVNPQYIDYVREGGAVNLNTDEVDPATEIILFGGRALIGVANSFDEVLTHMKVKPVDEQSSSPTAEKD